MTDSVKIEDVTNRLSMALGSAVYHIVTASSKNPHTAIEDIEKAVFYIEEELKSLSLPVEGDDLDNEWGEKVYELASRLTVNRQEAVEWICMGTRQDLQYALNFLDREIEYLKERKK